MHHLLAFAAILSISKIFAQSTAFEMSLLSQGTMPGIIHGKRMDKFKHKFKDSVVAVDKYGSGFVVEGCVVTAAHLVVAGDIYQGDEWNDPSIKKYSEKEKVKIHDSYKPETFDNNDLAVIKPKTPIPSKMSSSLSQIPSEYFNFSTRNTFAFGYGYSEIKEVSEAGYGEDSRPTTLHSYKLDKIGAKRFGEITLALTNAVSDPFYILRNERTHMVSQGDSGGPVIVFDGVKDPIIYGMTIGTENVAPEDVKYGLAVNLVARRQWLKDTLSELKCKPADVKAEPKTVDKVVTKKEIEGGLYSELPRGVGYERTEEDVRTYLELYVELSKPEDLQNWTNSFKNWEKNSPDDAKDFYDVLLGYLKIAHPEVTQPYNSWKIRPAQNPTNPKVFGLTYEIERDFIDKKTGEKKKNLKGFISLTKAR